MHRKIKYLAFCIAGFLIVTFFCGIILYYYYHHPSSIKSLIEKSISRSTGTSFTIKNLSYSLKPLKIRAKGITFKPAGKQHGFYLEIPDFNADITLEGAFGHKILTLKKLKINGFSFRLSERTIMPEISTKAESPSFFAKLLKGLTALFLFRDIKFQAAEVINSDIALNLGDQVVQVIAPHLHITTDRPVSLVDQQIGLILTAKGASIHGPVGNINNMEVKAGLKYNHKNKMLLFETVNLFFEAMSLKQKSERKSEPMIFHLKSEGILNLRNNNLNVPKFHLTVDDVLLLNGNLNAGFGPQTYTELKLLDCHIFPQRLKHLLPDRMKVMLAPCSLSGPMSIHGIINGLKEKQKWNWHCDLKAKFKQNKFSYTTGQARAAGRITGHIKAEGRFPEAKISGNIKADKTTFSGEGVEIKPFKTAFSLSGTHPIYQIKDLTAHIPLVKTVISNKDIFFDDIRVHVKTCRLDGEKRALFLPEIELDSSTLKNLVLSLTADKEQVVMQLRGKDVHIIESAIAHNLLPSGWQFSGLDSIQLMAVLKGKEDLSFVSRLGLQEFGFQNKDASSVGEKITINAEITGKISLRRPHISAKTSLKIDGGEILHDRFYFDLRSNPFFSSWEGRYNISEKSLQLSHLMLELKDIITLKLNAKLLHKAQDHYVHLSINIPRTSLEPVFHHFVLEPFQTEKPSLTALNIGGDISGNLKFKGSGTDWMILGNLMWQEGEISSGDKGLSFQGIHLDLPILYQSQKGIKGKRTAKGKLSVQTMNLPLLPKQPLTLKFDASPNLLSVRSPTTLKVPGGSMQVGPIEMRDIYSSQPSIETSLIMNSIKINPLLPEIWAHSIKGTIEGELDRIYFEKDTLSSHGEFRAKVFDGKIILSDLYASGVFTSAPAFRLNARWNDLNLAKITKGTSFGKIEGILNGHVRDLEIAYGQPQRFDLLLETVKKRGVSQKMSVKAVDNIAQIGGGQSPFIGIAGVYSSLFKEFSYKKIGIHASLENDVFRVNGTIKEGGKEYLVKRSRFSGINVVNQNPDNRISFKDMVKRIKRVSKRSAGPVLK